ncbi:hypothetical protein LTR08_001825 [Meristemomyces frigidus]|nr:hypothetical protein LTR08_001825 [Meristemomyces frigidus]
MPASAPAIFPHSWFEEAGPPNTNSSSLTALQAVPDNKAKAAPTAHSGYTTQVSPRRNSFDFVLTKVKEHEAAMSPAELDMVGERIAFPATAAKVGRDTTDSARSSEAIRQPETKASARVPTRSAGSETIELRDLPWHSVAQHSLKGPALPPIARLPRR